ncbi:helix-turn-helix domain-containing protein [Pseudooceanicola aestuarii]|uniref:helix-turn-helix domain-containing protein n=1 Tax=Pseudooceanicola aestuarii TaxID=2697319 RepID=UPI0013D1AC52|nr:helix-turn-helix domain-containing protein [Pseudooceanicola aestuarii]
MKHENVTAAVADAQDSCATSASVSFPGMGSLDQQPWFQPITRRDLMAAVNIVARDLGLRPASVVVVDALLSCLPCKDPRGSGDAPITPQVLLTVFAANDTLCFRAKGITDRQLRRHLERLEDAGLIRRRDSANGKRFPLYRGGKVVGAFGIDLTPLLLRAQELKALAVQRRAQADELRGLRACILKLRAQCLALTLGSEVNQFVEDTRNIMRRATTTLPQARAILNRLREILYSAPQSPETAAKDTPELPNQTGQMTATDGQNVRHKEPEKPDTKKLYRNDQPVSPAFLWDTLPILRSFFPEVPKDLHDLHRVIHDFGQMLRIGATLLGQCVARIGAVHTLKLQERIAQRLEEIDNPEGYLRRVLQNNDLNVGHGQQVNPSNPVRRCRNTAAEFGEKFAPVPYRCSGPRSRNPGIAAQNSARAG